MFRSVAIQGVQSENFDEECFRLEEAFFFTITIPSYYMVFNKNSEVIGIIPTGYNLFFTVDNYKNFEDIDMENVLRLFNANDDFSIVGTRDDSKKIILIHSSTISEFRMIEDKPINIPFTNRAFDSEGIVVFKNMSSLAEAINDSRKFIKK
jgi:hypothetical protein